MVRGGLGCLARLDVDVCKLLGGKGSLILNRIQCVVAGVGGGPGSSKASRNVKVKGGKKLGLLE